MALTIFTKNVVLDGWQGSEYASSEYKVFCPEYKIFVEMKILKTWQQLGDYCEGFWEIDVPKMSRNIERLQIIA